MTDTPAPPVPTQGWTARAVRSGKTVPNPKGAGELQKFWVDFEGEDGFQATGTYWRRKAGNDPREGESYSGTVTVGEFGYMFKKGEGTMGGGSGGGGKTTTGGGWQPESRYDPERTARITRSHAQNMAVRYLTAQGKPFTLKDVFDTATEFEIDVVKVGNKAAQGTGGEGPHSGASASPPPAQDVDPAELCQLLEAGGLNPNAAVAVTDHWMDARSKEEQSAAVERLAKPHMMKACIERMVKLTEEARGEPLPEHSTADDDIPF